jgi:hydrogenase nickel incorporation protein HypB
MCATCGCSGGGVLHPGAHDHGAGHRHDHAHDHGGHAPDHGAGHSHAGDARGHERPRGDNDAGGGGGVQLLGRARDDQRRAALVRLERDVLARNNGLAAENRGFFAGRGVLALNLISSPGSGKTALLERTLRDLGGERDLAVIEGDQETARDAERIRAAGGRAVQINTGAGCHLDAGMVGRALPALELKPGGLLFIENVGNLVCPALFDLGERAKVVVFSVTEGEDKPLKYPHAFRAAAVALVNKVDLLPHVAFDIARCEAYAREVNPGLAIFRVSATRGDGLAAWYDWLRAAARPA